MLEMMQARYSESWYKTECPYCGAINWFSNGDESDLYQTDIDSIECHSCRMIYWFGPPLEDQTEPQDTAKGIILERPKLRDPLREEV